MLLPHDTGQGSGEQGTLTGFSHPHACLVLFQVIDFSYLWLVIGGPADNLKFARIISDGGKQEALSVKQWEAEREI